jgi:guanylate kinase
VSSCKTSNKNLIFVISGPSGSGKTTLLKNLFKDKTLKDKLARSISFTTRARRPGEKRGGDYFFITERKFREKLEAKKILEWTRFLNYYYGTSKSYFQRLTRQGKHVLLCLDEKGAFKIKRLFADRTVTIFIQPPRIDSLRFRMASPERTTDKEDLTRRLSLAKNQMRVAKYYDYRIVNDDFDAAFKKLKDVILQVIS